MGVFDAILTSHGVDVTHLKRETSGALTSQGTIKAVIVPLEATDLRVEPGHSLDEYKRAFTSAEMAHHDRLQILGVDYIVTEPQHWSDTKLGEDYYDSAIRRLQD